jgi:hypothetical protein
LARIRLFFTSPEILSVRIGIVASSIAIGKKRYSVPRWTVDMNFVQGMKQF